MATATAAAMAYGIQSLLRTCSRGHCSGFAATISGRNERVGGTGAAAWPRPELRLGDSEMAALSSANKLPTAATHGESEQK
jgi:hypothetical protein